MSVLSCWSPLANLAYHSLSSHRILDVPHPSAMRNLETAGAAPLQFQGQSGSTTFDSDVGPAGRLPTVTPSSGGLDALAAGARAGLDHAIAGVVDGRTSPTGTVVNRGNHVGRSPLVTTGAMGVADTHSQVPQPSAVSLDMVAAPARPQQASAMTTSSPDKPISLAVAGSPSLEYKKDNPVPARVIGLGDRTSYFLPPDGDSDVNTHASATTAMVGRWGGTSLTDTVETSVTATSGTVPLHDRKENKDVARVLEGVASEAEKDQQLSTVVDHVQTNIPATPVYVSGRRETAIETGAAGEATPKVDQGMLGATADMVPTEEDGRDITVRTGIAPPVAEAGLLSSPGSSLAGSGQMEYPSSADTAVEEGGKSAGEGGEDRTRKRERHNKGERKRHHKHKRKHKHHHRHKGREEGEGSGSRRGDGRGHGRDGCNDGDGEGRSYISPPTSPTNLTLAPLKRVALPLQATLGVSGLVDTSSPDALVGGEYSSRGAGAVGSVSSAATVVDILVEKPAAGGAVHHPTSAMGTVKQPEGPAFFRPDGG